MIYRSIFPCLSLIIVALVLATASPAHAQTRGQRKEVPKPEVVTMQTKDGVELTGTYYKSTDGKNATPVVMLADLKDSRAVYDQFARRLQAGGKLEDLTFKSFAVLTVDMRGHGDSTKQRGPGGRGRDIDAGRLDPGDLVNMVRFDMNAVRKFLVQKNDAGELNLNKLSIVGAGLGASVAVNWAAVDWSFPPLAVGKQGQDVKALVLISPEWSYRGLRMNEALRQPGVREKIAVLVMYGAGERRNTADAKRIEKQIERYHKPPESLPPGEPNSLALIGPDTKLQGTKLLNSGGTSAEKSIIKFLTVHVADKDYEWLDRPKP